jgi:hypothetical protein
VCKFRPRERLRCSASSLVESCASIKWIFKYLRLTAHSVAVAAVVQLALFWRVLSDPDITFSQWLPIVCNQLVLSLSFVTACLSYLKPFMESLESGVIRVENVPGSEEELSGNRTGSSGYYLSALSSSMNSASKSRSGPSPNPGGRDDRDIRLTTSWAVDTQESTAQL